MKKYTAIFLFCITSIILAGCSKDSPTDARTPTALSTPWPANAATGISTAFTLSWSCTGTDAGEQAYDVYLSTSNPPDSQVAAGLSVTTYSCAGLAASTDYYWKIAAKGNKGTTNSPVWSFATGSGVYTPGMVTVAGGTFVPRGTTVVTISGFKIDRYEVTYELWTDVITWASTNGYADLTTGQNGSSPIGSDNPVTMVNWFDAVKWCNARSEKDELTPVYYTDNSQTTIYRTGEIDINIGAVDWNANGYRLPTESEWEFAARGGNASRGYIYSGSAIVDNVAWYSGNSGNATHTVGTRSANELGIYDMSGNAYEWTWDWWFSADVYPYGGTMDPKGPSTTQTYRIMRGGFFGDEESICDVRSRGINLNGQYQRIWLIGLRCIRH